MTPWTVRLRVGASGPAWPAAVHSSGRYILDQFGRPWLMLADGTHAMLNRLSLTDVDTFMVDRGNRGFNGAWLILVNDTGAGGVDSGADNAGNIPFTGGSFASPVAAFWSRVDTVVTKAAANGVTLLMGPIETAGAAMTTARTNGNAGCFTYGQFLGNRYKNSPNIMWFVGNDFGGGSSWIAGPPSQADDTLMENISAGIKNAGDTHLQTCELNFNRSLSTDDSSTGGWRTVADLNLAYTYYPTYDCVFKGYLGINSNDALTQAQRYAPKPVFLGEANYEAEDNPAGQANPATPYILRQQAYWTVLGGGLAGQAFGNHYIWGFLTGWDTSLGISSTGSAEAGIWATFFRSIAFHTLVPDSGHVFLTSGFGTYDGSTSNLITAVTNTYATGALAPDGSLGVVYTPVNQGLVVDMTKMRGSTVARWFNPTTAAYTAIGTFPASGSQTFTPSGTHSDGKADWVLVLTA